MSEENQYTEMKEEQNETVHIKEENTYEKDSHEKIQIDFISPIAKVEETRIEAIEPPQTPLDTPGLPLDFEPKTESSYSVGDFIKSACYGKIFIFS